MLRHCLERVTGGFFSGTVPGYLPTVHPYLSIYIYNPWKLPILLVLTSSRTHAYQMTYHHTIIHPLHILPQYSHSHSPSYPFPPCVTSVASLPNSIPPRTLRLSDPFTHRGRWPGPRPLPLLPPLPPHDIRPRGVLQARIAVLLWRDICESQRKEQGVINLWQCYATPKTVTTIQRNNKHVMK